MFCVFYHFKHVIQPSGHMDFPKFSGSSGPAMVALWETLTEKISLLQSPECWHVCKDCIKRTHLSTDDGLYEIKAFYKKEKLLLLIVYKWWQIKFTNYQLTWYKKSLYFPPVLFLKLIPRTIYCPADFVSKSDWFCK